MAANGDLRMPNGQFGPGHSGGPGRPLGTPNRTRFLRERIEDAIEAAGGQSWINRIVRENPVEAIKLLARLQPKEAMQQVAQAKSIRVVMYKEKPPEGLPKALDRTSPNDRDRGLFGENRRRTPLASIQKRGGRTGSQDPANDLDHLVTPTE